MAKITTLFALSMLFLVNIAVAQDIDTLSTALDSTATVNTTQRTVSEPELGLIVPPVGFDSSVYFHGYLSFLKRAAIIMYEIDDLDPQTVMSAATDEYFIKNNMTFLAKKEFVSVHGTVGFYMKSSYEDKGTKYIRYMVYAGNNNSTLILDIVHPADVELEEELLECMNSINYTR
ncbi:MAG: hypothetical protein QNK23_17330 [Crocinitomicaceae bacterium]|nr:hypothetical protein [Crocinitomicaceae bacterium]